MFHSLSYSYGILSSCLFAGFIWIVSNGSITLMKEDQETLNFKILVLRLWSLYWARSCTMNFFTLGIYNNVSSWAWYTLGKLYTIYFPLLLCASRAISWRCSYQRLMHFFGNLEFRSAVCKSSMLHKIWEIPFINGIITPIKQTISFNHPTNFHYSQFLTKKGKIITKIL